MRNVTGRFDLLLDDPDERCGPGYKGTFDTLEEAKLFANDEDVSIAGWHLEAIDTWRSIHVSTPSETWVIEPSTQEGSTCSCCHQHKPTTRHSSNAHVNSGQAPDMCEECYAACPVEGCVLASINQGGSMNMPTVAPTTCTACGDPIVYANVGNTASMGWVSLTTQDDNCAVGGQHNPSLSRFNGGNASPEEEDKPVVPNPETVRRIEVIDMALSFGADPETSMPLTDDKRRLLEQEKALLQGGSTPDEAHESQQLAADEDEVIRLLMGSQPPEQPTPEPQPATVDITNDVPPQLMETLAKYGVEGVEVEVPPTQEVQTSVQTPGPAEQGGPIEMALPLSQPTAPAAPAPVPSIGEQVKAAVTESLAQLLGAAGGGNSSLDDLLSKLDPRDSESALKMFTWLWENHRFQVIGQLAGGGYLLHYAEPKGTSQAGYIPGGTKGGRMVDQALATAKENPAAAHRGMCPQCMSAVKQMDATGQVLSDDGTDNPNCPAGGNHAFAG